MIDKILFISIIDIWYNAFLWATFDVALFTFRVATKENNMRSYSIFWKDTDGRPIRTLVNASSIDGARAKFARTFPERTDKIVSKRIYMQLFFLDFMRHCKEIPDIPAFGK